MLPELCKSFRQWCRYVLNIGDGGSWYCSRVKPSNCFRCLEKSVFHFVSRMSFIADVAKFAVISDNSFFKERTRHFRWSKHTLTPPTYFQGEVKTQTPKICPLSSGYTHISYQKRSGAADNSWWLSLTNRATFRGQSRSPNMVPFHMLRMVAYCVTEV